MQFLRQAMLVILIGLVDLTVLMGAHATGPSPYGPETKRFGAGLYLGNPTGLTLKGYLTKQWALGGIVAWSFVDESMTLIGDATFDLFDIAVNSSKLTLPFYVGGGAKISFDKGGRNNNRTVAGLRIPVGVALQWTHYPIEVFLEIAPGMELTPSTKFDLSGGVGARFYF